MPYVNEVSGVSVRDVRAAFDALYEDLGMEARIVVFVRRGEIAPNALSFVAQVVNSQGMPVDGIQDARQGWPNNQFKTVTQALFWVVWRLYGYAEAAAERAARGTSEAKGIDAGSAD